MALYSRHYEEAKAHIAQVVQETYAGSRFNYTRATSKARSR